jgi:hypothetical protein
MESDTVYSFMTDFFHLYSFSMFIQDFSIYMSICHFLWLNNLFLCKFAISLNSIYSFVDICLIFHFLTSINHDSIYKLCEDMFSFCLGMYFRVELLSHLVSLCLTFWWTSGLYSKSSVLFDIHTSYAWQEISPTSL